MVLEDTAFPTPQSDFSSTFDFDGQESTKQPQIDISNLPKGLPIFGRLFGFNDARLIRSINENIKNFVDHVHRPTTKDEAEAIAYHTAKAHSIVSYGQPLGLAAGAYQAWSTRKSYKFPFVKAKEGFDGNVLQFRNIVLAQGQMARLFWHTARMGVYGAVGMWVVGIGVAGYAASVSAVGQLSDPRLKDLVQAIRDERKAQLERQGIKPPLRRDPTGQGPTNASDLWKNHRGAIGAPEVDDGSPTAGQASEFADPQDMDTSFYGNKSDDMSDGQAASVPARPKQSRIRRGPAWNRAAESRSMDADESSPTGFYSDIDDASPTASSTGSVNGIDTQGKGKAWERLRKEAGINPSTTGSSRPRRRRPSPQQEMREDESNDADSYSFSNSDAEKQLSREQAQRDFDAQLEREMRGETFDSNNRGSGW
ncbi:hypothetical protein MMC34_001731 [Xylographa carneopallida]|nr:hypothetical protein [Xylographa carneopallida]